MLAERVSERSSSQRPGRPKTAPSAIIEGMRRSNDRFEAVIADTEASVDRLVLRARELLSVAGAVADIEGGIQSLEESEERQRAARDSNTQKLLDLDRQARKVLKGVYLVRFSNEVKRSRQLWDHSVTMLRDARWELAIARAEYEPPIGEAFADAESLIEALRAS